MKWVIGIGVFIVAFAIGLSVYLQPNDFALCPMTDQPVTREGCDPADAIVAISGGDTEERTRHAIELYKNNWAPLIIFSGAAEDKSGPSNAAAMREQAVSAGVPRSDIITEGESENTRQNAFNTRDILTQKGINNILLVTSGYHQRRAYLEFSRSLEGYEVIVRNSPTYDRDWGWYWWLTPRGWYLAISEFIGVIMYHFGANQ